MLLKMAKDLGKLPVEVENGVTFGGLIEWMHFCSIVNDAEVQAMKKASKKKGR